MGLILSIENVLAAVTDSYTKPCDIVIFRIKSYVTKRVIDHVAFVKVGLGYVFRLSYLTCLFVISQYTYFSASFINAL